MRWHPLIAGLSILLGAILGGLALLPPAPLAADADPGNFSAGRAGALVAAFAREPHLIGTPANARVRDRIVTALRDLGLEVETRQAQVVYDHPAREETRTRVAWPENIIARLPGDGRRRGTGEALALMSHYDSAATGHGAADAMSGVAAILETLRAIRARGGLLERDLIVLITDGEEVGLFGAQAFFRTSPMAAEIGLLLNFEARGAAGVASMFQTGPGNGGWIRRFRDVAPWPVASSLSVEVYRRMPNDTDATITLDAGIPFFNFAFIDDYFRYHAGADIAANLSPRSVQHAGDNMLALVDHFGFSAWPDPATDATYFSVGRGLLLAYGPSLVLGLSILAGLLALFAIVRIAQREGWGAPFVGAGALLACLAIAYAVAAGLYGAARAATPAFHLFYQYHPLLLAWLGAGVATLAMVGFPTAQRRSGLALLFLLALLPGLGAGGLTLPLPALLAAGVGVLGLALPRRSPKRGTLLAGALLLWLLLTAAVTALVPDAAYVFAWPLLAAAAATVVGSRARWPASATGWTAPTLTVLALLWIPLLYSVYLGLAIRLPGVIAGLVVLVLALAWPAITGPLARRGLALAGIASLLLVPWAAARDPFSARFPEPVELFLGVTLADASGDSRPAATARTPDGSAAWWMSRSASLSAVERRALGPAPERFDLSTWSPGSRGEGWRTRTPEPPAFDASSLAGTVRAVETGGVPRWRLELSLRPAVTGARIQLTLPDHAYRAATLNGRTITLPVLEDEWRWDFWGVRSDRPLRLVIEGSGPAPESLRLDEFRYGTLAAEDLPGGPRPERTMARPWSLDRGIWLRQVVQIE